MIQPSVSLCIPTYNRAEMLRALLDSIIAAGPPERFEIVVSDNASTDHTPEVVRAYADLLPIRYIRNPENVGANRNLVVASQAARNEYVWLFGDDDLLLPDTFKLLAEALSSRPHGALLDWDMRDQHCEALQEASMLRIKTSRTVNRDDLLARLYGRIGLLSCMVIRRDLWGLTTPEVHDRWAPTGFNHVYAFYRALAPSARIRLQAGPVFIQRGDNSGGFAWAPYFAAGMAQVFTALRGFGYSERAIIAAKSRQAYTFVARCLVTSIIRGERPAGILGLMHRHYWMTPTFWGLLLPLSLAPVWLLQFQRRMRA